MADDVSVSWQGTQQLVEITRDQYLNLSSASGFTCTAQLANTGAFSGFLSIFKGTYQNALDAMTDSLNDAMEGAQRLSQRIADVREDLRATDQGIEVLHTRLEDQVSCQPYTPGGGDAGVPQVPDNLVNANNVLSNIKTPMPGPPVPGLIDKYAPATPAAPLDMADNLLSMAGNADDTGQGLDHAEAADDFVEANR